MKSIAEKIKIWKTEADSQTVFIVDEKKNKSEGLIFLKSFDSKAKLKRALKILGTIWGIGLFSIIFPIIHFFIPPLLFLLAPFFASKIYRQSSVVIGGIGRCPQCQTEFEIVRSNYLKTEDEWPLLDQCSHCRIEVSIERVSESF